LIFFDIAARPSPADVAAERFARFRHGETRVWDAATERLVTTPLTDVPKEKTRPRDDSLAAQ
jgi:hypothetical protein